MYYQKCSCNHLKIQYTAFDPVSAVISSNITVLKTTKKLSTNVSFSNAANTELYCYSN